MVSARFGNGSRGLCKSQDVLDFADTSFPAALDSFSLAGGFAVFVGFRFIAATALAIRSLKYMSTIL